MEPLLIPVRCHQGYLEPPPQEVHVDTPLLLPGSTLRSCESSYHIGPPLKKHRKKETNQDFSLCDNSVLAVNTVCTI